MIIHPPDLSLFSIEHILRIYNFFGYRDVGQFIPKIKIGAFVCGAPAAKPQLTALFMTLLTPDASRQAGLRHEQPHKRAQVRYKETDALQEQEPQCTCIPHCI
jgi:hypothetical protein